MSSLFSCSDIRSPFVYPIRRQRHSRAWSGNRGVQLRDTQTFADLSIIDPARSASRPFTANRLAPLTMQPHRVAAVFAASGPADSRCDASFFSAEAGGSPAAIEQPLTLLLSKPGNCYLLSGNGIATPTAT